MPVSSRHIGMRCVECRSSHVRSFAQGMFVCGRLDAVAVKTAKAA
jgi:hypothetical protein